MYSIILFDLDGTLIDPKEGITKSVQYALTHFGIEEPDLNHLTRFIGPPLKQSFMTYYNFDETTSQIAIEKYRERFSTIGIFENNVYRGIQDMLSELQQMGKILAVATSKPQVYAEKILEKYDLQQYFQVVIGSELDGTRSNKADVIEEVFKRLNVTPETKKETIMVGDRKHDILGAKACGIHSIGVEFGYAEVNELNIAGADFIVSSVNELKNLLVHTLHSSSKKP